MKIRLVYLCFLAALGLVFLTSNKNGRASEAKRGNTGAPGDETNFNGSPRTCNYCHFGASGPQVFIHLIDADGDTVTQYLPGQEYTARVTIANSNPNLTGYGFQMIALRNADTTDLDGFSDPGNNTVNNYKLATIANGRTYAEHDNVSVNVNQFNVVWKAPAAGTGPVTFYAAGNAVNRNGSTSGDGAAATSLQLEESNSTSTGAPGLTAFAVSAWPNPTSDLYRLALRTENGGDYRLRVVDLNGRLQWETNRSLHSGEHSLELDARVWKPGLYLLEVSAGNRNLATLKLFKI